MYQIVALSDTNVAWSKSLGLDLDLSAKGLGVRTNRYVLILDNLHVKNIEVRPRSMSQFLVSSPPLGRTEREQRDGDGC